MGYLQHKAPSSMKKISEAESVVTPETSRKQTRVK